jgi:hypothetical protein
MTTQKEKIGLENFLLTEQDSGDLGEPDSVQEAEFSDKLTAEEVELLEARLKA